ncbi:MAG: hypothetical protein ABIL62_07105 [Planctomycetota bacterium]
MQKKFDKDDRRLYRIGISPELTQICLSIVCHRKRLTDSFGYGAGRYSRISSKYIVPVPPANQVRCAR